MSPRDPLEKGQDMRFKMSAPRSHKLLELHSLRHLDLHCTLYFCVSVVWLYEIVDQTDKHLALIYHFYLFISFQMKSRPTIGENGMKIFHKLKLAFISCN